MINSTYPGMKSNSGLYIVVALTVSIFTLGLFGGIAWNTLIQNSMAEFDESVIRLVRSFASPYMDVFMVNITNVGSALFYSQLSLLAVFLLVWLKHKHEAVALVLCVAGAALLNEVLKQLFQRSRPDTLPLLEIGGYSFPSGHAMVSLCCYGILAFLIARNIASWRARAMVITITGLFIAIVGISRIYVGVHYPTDVLAGFAIGAAWLAFCIALFLWWKHRITKFYNINLP